MFVILHNLTDLSKRVKLGNVIADAVSRMCVFRVVFGFG